MDGPNWIQIAGGQLLRIASPPAIVGLRGAGRNAWLFETFFREAGVEVVGSAVNVRRASAAVVVGLGGYRTPIEQIEGVTRLLGRDEPVLVTTRTTSPHTVAEGQPFAFPSWPRFLWALYLGGLDVSKIRAKRFVGHRVVIAYPQADGATAFHPPPELVKVTTDEEDRPLYEPHEIEEAELNWEAAEINTTPKAIEG